MKVYPDMRSRYLIWFLLTYWFVWIIIFQALHITPECLEKTLLTAEPNDDICLDSFSDSYLHPFTCDTFICTEIIMCLIAEYSSAKLLAEELGSHAISSWKPGLNLLVRNPVDHLLDPKEVGGSLIGTSLSFKKPLQFGDTPQGSGGS